MKAVERRGERRLWDVRLIYQTDQDKIRRSGVIDWRRHRPGGGGGGGGGGEHIDLGVRWFWYTNWITE